MPKKLWLASLALLTCIAPRSAAATPTAPLEIFGTIRRLTEQRDFGPKASLDKVLLAPHAYGLGSLSGLRGEITIVDGVAWLAFPPATEGGNPRVTSSTASREAAAFLIVTHLPPSRWRRVTLPEALSLEELDRTLERLNAPDPASTSANEKTNPDQSFPFRIEGRFTTITLAIIDGRRVPPGPGSESSLEKANVLQPLTKVDGTLVGFYSAAADSAFTHAGKHSHVHAVLPAKRATGHAQEFQLAPGATLFLP